MIERVANWFITVDLGILVLIFVLAATWSFLRVLVWVGDRAFPAVEDAFLFFDYLCYRSEFKKWHKKNKQRPAG